MSQLSRLIPTSGPGSGTVTSISAGEGITLTPNPIVATGTVALTVPVVIADGGTNAITMTNTDGVIYFDGTSLVTTAAGTTGQVLTGVTGSAPTFQSPAAVSISITGDTGGALTGNAFTFTGGTTGLSFGGSGTTETLTFAGITANNGVVNLGTDNAANAINIGLGTTARAIHIGDSNAAHVITIGSTTGAAKITQEVGTGNFSLDGVAGSTYDIGASTTTGTIAIGGTLQSGSITIGRSTTTYTVNICTGSGFGVGTVNIANGSTNQNIVNIANTASNNNITIGKTSGSGSISLNSGSGGITATGVASVAVANKNYVTINTSTGKLGSDAGPASSISITGNTGGALTGNAFTFTGGTTGLTFAGAGTTETLGGTLVISNGGTNATSMTNTDGVVYYDGTRLVTTTVGTIGEVLTSNGAGFAPTFQSLAAAISTITGNVGPAESPSSGNFNIVTFGTNVLFHGSAATQTLDFNQSNILLGATGSITVGTDNTGVGLIALASNTSGADNTAVGFQALEGSTTSNECTAIGSFSLFHATIGADNNTGVGYESLGTLTTGTNNTAIGHAAGFSLATTDSSNICIGNSGVGGDNNTMRIGTSGSGAGQVDACYLAGVNGVSVGSVASVVSISGDHLGSTVITNGSNISVVAGANTITISANTASQSVNYTPVNFAASPYSVVATDYYIGANVTGGAITVRLPNSPSTGTIYVVKDVVGLAATSNITITTVGGVVNIDGATSFVMNTAYESVQLIFNGVSYEVY